MLLVGLLALMLAGLLIFAMAIGLAITDPLVALPTYVILGGLLWWGWKREVRLTKEARRHPPL
jgi:hypothetical protein